MNFGAMMAGGIPSIGAHVGSAVQEVNDQQKKEGLRNMLTGIGKGMKDDSMRLRPLPQQQPFDVQSFLASLFGA